MPLRIEIKTVDTLTILDEVSSEASKLYYDYPYLSIWQAIEMARRLIEEKYKHYEVTEEQQERFINF